MPRFATTLILATVLFACDPRPSNAPVTRELPQTSSSSRDAAGVDTARDAPQPQVATPPASTDCGGLRGVQRLRLIDRPEGAKRQFRFGEGDQAHVYEVVWTGDLNDDGIEDRIARRDSEERPVWMVLVGCGEQFAVAWVGLATQVAPTETATRVDERDWNDLQLRIEGVTRTLEFNGTKYVMSR